MEVCCVCVSSSPYNDANAGIEYFLSLVFLIDILVLFNLPRVRDDGLLETSRSRVAYHYLRLACLHYSGFAPVGLCAHWSNKVMDGWLLWKWPLIIIM